MQKSASALAAGPAICTQVPRKREFSCARILVRDLCTVRVIKSSLSSAQSARRDWITLSQLDILDCALSDVEDVSVIDQGFKHVQDRKKHGENEK